MLPPGQPVLRRDQIQTLQNVQIEVFRFGTTQLGMLFHQKLHAGIPLVPPGDLAQVVIGRIDPPLGHMGREEAVIYPEVIGIVVQHLVILLDRILEITLFPQRVSQVEEGVGVSHLLSQTQLTLVADDLQTVALVGPESEAEVLAGQGYRVHRIRFYGDQVDPLSGSQAAGNGPEAALQLGHQPGFPGLVTLPDHTGEFRIRGLLDQTLVPRLGLQGILPDILVAPGRQISGPGPGAG